MLKIYDVAMKFVNKLIHGGQCASVIDLFNVLAPCQWGSDPDSYPHKLIVLCNILSVLHNVPGVLCNVLGVLLNAISVLRNVLSML